MGGYYVGIGYWLLVMYVSYYLEVYRIWLLSRSWWWCSSWLMVLDFELVIIEMICILWFVGYEIIWWNLVNYEKVVIYIL